MNMMGQMGGMMQEMVGPYGPEVQQRHRQQLQGMQQELDNIVAVSAKDRTGSQIFARNCNSCHPQGGNTIRPDLPLRGSSKLKDSAPSWPLSATLSCRTAPSAPCLLFLKLNYPASRPENYISMSQRAIE